jgi:hypothetical protein
MEFNESSAFQRLLAPLETIGCHCPLNMEGLHKATSVYLDKQLSLDSRGSAKVRITTGDKTYTFVPLQLVSKTRNSENDVIINGYPIFVYLDENRITGVTDTLYNIDCKCNKPSLHVALGIDEATKNKTINDMRCDGLEPEIVNVINYNQ